jgi:predicted nucleic acid-binding protein
LLCAFRRDSPRHAEYRQWLEALVNAQAAYGIAPQVLASLIRISTHTRI